MIQVEEILQKEEEKHQLVRLGIVADWRKTVERAVPHGARFHNATEGFAKGDFLRYFYRTFLDYGRFIDREKHSNEQLKKRLYRKTQTFVAARCREQPALLDRELKTGSHLTLAYLLSDNIYNAFYDAFCEAEQSFDTPDEVDAFFRREAGKKYPFYIDEYVDALKNNDPSFWAATCLYLRDLAAYIARNVTERLGKTADLDMISEDTWTKAYEILKARLVEQTGNIPVFRSGKDFRNYLIQTCYFLAGNLCRKYDGGKEVYLEDLFPYGPNDLDAEADEMTAHRCYGVEEVLVEPFEHGGDELKELEVDVDNPYEVAYAVSIILLDPGHALHRVLAEGIEDKVALLIDKAVHGMSYREIVASRYGNSLPEEELRRTEAKARKEYERVRKTLTLRLIKLVREKKNRIRGGSEKWRRTVSHHISVTDNVQKQPL